MKSNLMTQTLDDTHPRIKQMLIERQRKMSDAEKWQRVTELTQMVELMARADVREQCPEATERECQLRVAARRLPADVMRKAFGYDDTKGNLLMLPEPIVATSLVIRVLEQQGIVYWIGGSMASSKYGDQRSTQDVDIVAKMRAEHVPALAEAWQQHFYVDEELMYDAIRLQSSFNIIHLETTFKADIFIARSDAWTEEEASRRRLVELIPGHESTLFYIASPEDMILQKLNWFRMTNGVSERQWRDVQKMLEVQSQRLEYDYLRYWAAELNLSVLLKQAMTAAGIAQP